MKSLRVTLLAALTLVASASALATEFVPPNDTTGQVWTTNSNDAWADGRGIIFNVSSATDLTSVGVYQDLTNKNLTWTLSDWNSPSTIFASGGGLVSTPGLAWIDFATSVALSVGTSYHLEFSFAGNSNQNFFYNNQNVPWSQGVYTALEGTQGGYADNFVVGAFRVNEGATQSVPDSGSAAAFLGLAFVGLAAAARRNRR